MKYHLLFTLNKVIEFCWIPSHIGIRGNEYADAAAKAALNLPLSNIKIPYSDFKQRVNSHFKDKWQISWNNAAFNKLKPIKPTLGDTKLTDIVRRRDEVVLHRARLGQLPNSLVSFNG